jgi:hypothetical protein
MTLACYVTNSRTKSTRHDVTFRLLLAADGFGTRPWHWLFWRFQYILTSDAIVLVFVQWPYHFMSNLSIWSFIVFKLELSYDLRSVGQSFLVPGSHLEPMIRFLFSVWQLLVSCCGAPSLTRGCVCNLVVQLFLGLARAVTLRSKSRRTQTIFYCLIWDSPNLEG